ncbi:helix-turn-helix domain-containing protein [Thermomonospora umbrina]|uniref:helix-turn-helix domain-containing protein n=1 Tax=Thermomonospora umbrina TaxID=111806 RepID=UPI00319E2FBE
MTRRNPSRAVQLTPFARLESGFNAQEAARRPGVHHQTVRYRVRQIDDLFGPALRDFRRRLELQLAVRHRLLTTS